LTSEEIKDCYSMRDIVGRYGFIPDRKGFISCPFHQENTASMRIYEKDYNCFGCGENGDIFDFIMRIEDVNFKEAFQSLGGTYRKPSFSSDLAVYRSRKKKEMARKTRERQAEKKRLNHMLISVYRTYMERSEPFSDIWCDCYNALQYQLYIQGELNGTKMR